MERANGVTPFFAKSDGSVSPVGTISLNKSLVTDFEAAMKNSSDVSTIYAEIVVATMELALESTIFHELTHYGDLLDGQMDHTGISGGMVALSGYAEGGKRFEKAVYGEDLVNYQIGHNGPKTDDKYNDVRAAVLARDPSLAARYQGLHIQSTQSRPRLPKLKKPR